MLNHAGLKLNPAFIKRNIENIEIFTDQLNELLKNLINNLKKRDFINYLGTYIDKNLNWDYRIKHVSNRIAKNTGIINKLRYYLDLKTLNS